MPASFAWAAIAAAVHRHRAAESRRIVASTAPTPYDAVAPLLAASAVAVASLLLAAVAAVLVVVVAVLVASVAVAVAVAR